MLEVVQRDASLSDLEVKICRLCEMVVVERALQSGIVLLCRIEHDERIVEEFLSSAALCSFLASEILSQSRLCFSGCDYVEPIGLRMLRSGCEDLDLVAAIEHVGHRLQLAVDLCADTMFAELRVQLESEIERCRALRHGLDFSTRCEDEHFAREEVELEGIEEVHGIRFGIIEDFLDGSEPFVEFVFASFVGFVFPMCSESALCYFVHSVGADLDFYPLSVGRHDGYMKRFVPVGFGR